MVNYFVFAMSTLPLYVLCTIIKQYAADTLCDADLKCCFVACLAKQQLQDMQLLPYSKQATVYREPTIFALPAGNALEILAHVDPLALLAPQAFTCTRDEVGHAINNCNHCCYPHSSALC